MLRLKMPCYGDVVSKLELQAGFPVSALAQKCQQKHLPLISLNFKWRLVAPFLLLTVQQIEDIEIDGKNEQERRLMCLRTWSESLGDKATYGGLLRALILSNLKEQALNVVLILLRDCAPHKSTRESSISDEVFLTPPQTPPRPVRSRHTQTDDSLETYWTPPPSIDASTVSSDGRVLNQYVSLPSPRLQGSEQAAKAYLSTNSCTRLPFKDCSTQTDPAPHADPAIVPAAHMSSRPLPALPQLPPTPPSQVRSSQPHPQSHIQPRPHSRTQPQDPERGSRATGVTITYTRKTICFCLLVPLTLVLGVLMLGSVITYGIVYAIRN